MTASPLSPLPRFLIGEDDTGAMRLVHLDAPVFAARLAETDPETGAATGADADADTLSGVTFAGEDFTLCEVELLAEDDPAPLSAALRDAGAFVAARREADRAGAAALPRAAPEETAPLSRGGGVLSPAEIAQIGLALSPRHTWKADLAADLPKNLRLIQRLARGDIAAHAGFRDELLALSRRRLAALAEAVRLLEASAAAFPDPRAGGKT